MTPDPVYWSSLRQAGVGIESDPVPYIVAGRIANEARQGEVRHRLQNRALASENAERVGRFYDLVAEGRPTPGYDAAERQRLIELAEGAVPQILLAPPYTDDVDAGSPIRGRGESHGGSTPLPGTSQSFDGDEPGEPREGRGYAPVSAVMERPGPTPTEDEPRKGGALRAMSRSVTLSPTEEPPRREEVRLPLAWDDGQVANEAHRAIDSVARVRPKPTPRVLTRGEVYSQGPRLTERERSTLAARAARGAGPSTARTFLERNGGTVLAIGVMLVALSLFLTPAVYGYAVVGVGGATSVAGMWGLSRSNAYWSDRLRPTGG